MNVALLWHRIQFAFTITLHFGPPQLTMRLALFNVVRRVLALRTADERWEYLNDVMVAAGTVQPRLKPGVAIAILRNVLAALSALYREGIVHGHVRPSNLISGPRRTAGQKSDLVAFLR